jgi:hypothetical protein
VSDRTSGSSDEVLQAPPVGNVRLLQDARETDEDMEATKTIGASVTSKHRPKQLGQMLVDRGLLTQEQLDSALRDHQSMPKSLGRSLIDLGYIKERDLVSALAEQVGLDFVDLSQYQIDPVAATLVPDQLARRYRALPIGECDGKLLVAMSDPANLYALDDIRTVTNREIQPVVAIASDVQHAIEKLAASRADDVWSATGESAAPGVVGHVEVSAAPEAAHDVVDEQAAPGGVHAHVDEPAPTRPADAGERAAPDGVRPDVNEPAAPGAMHLEMAEGIPVVHRPAVPVATESQTGASVPLDELVARLTTLTGVLAGVSIALILATIVLIVVAMTT